MNSNVPIIANGIDGGNAQHAFHWWKDFRKFAESTNKYIATVKRKIDAGDLALRSDPIVKPDQPISEMVPIGHRDNLTEEMPPTASEIATASSLPTVYAWVPEKIFPGIDIKCPACKSKVTSAHWARDKLLHGLATQMVYITKEYTCYHCVVRPCLQHAATSLKDQVGCGKRKRKRFQADTPETLSTFPPYVRDFWKFVNSGRILCEMGVIDFVRAAATRTSWSAIADMINEIKEEAWARDVGNTFARLCGDFDIHPPIESCRFPTSYRLSADWVRNAYMADATKRHACIQQELSSETGDEVLALDWTVDAASRCSGRFLFNAMDGRRRILVSSLTTSCSPHEIQPLLSSLQERDVDPKVVYVDCECCGAWPRIIKNIWPKAVVRLDGMHAIRRLTQTTSSTQHPWHNRFCAAIAEAIYTYDAEAMNTFIKARLHASQQRKRTQPRKSRFVPRAIVNPDRILRDIEHVLEKFQNAHATAGAILTQGTLEAWRNLRSHVSSGCLCDPPGVQLHEYGKPVYIGGQMFKPICTIRGLSALEGFHHHQKQWLGSMSKHSPDAGAALLADGTARWNRKRRREDDAWALEISV